MTQTGQEIEIFALVGQGLGDVTERAKKTRREVVGLGY